MTQWNKAIAIHLNDSGSILTAATQTSLYPKKRHSIVRSHRNWQCPPFAIHTTILNMCEMYYEMFKAFLSYNKWIAVGDGPCQCFVKKKFNGKRKLVRLIHMWDCENEILVDGRDAIIVLGIMTSKWKCFCWLGTIINNV